jgi:hypothetical protein
LLRKSHDISHLTQLASRSIFNGTILATYRRCRHQFRALRKDPRA